MLNLTVCVCMRLYQWISGSRSSSVSKPARTTCVHCGRSWELSSVSWPWYHACCLGWGGWRWGTTGCSSECPLPLGSHQAVRAYPTWSRNTGWWRLNHTRSRSHDRGFILSRWLQIREGETISVCLCVPVQWFVEWCSDGLHLRTSQNQHLLVQFLTEKNIEKSFTHRSRQRPTHDKHEERETHWQ